jgi:hypothetical protein
MAISALAYIEKNAPLRRVIMNDPDIFTLSPKEDRFSEVNQAAMAILKQILELLGYGSFWPVRVLDCPRGHRASNHGGLEH